MFFNNLNLRYLPNYAHVLFVFLQSVNWNSGLMDIHFNFLENNPNLIVVIKFNAMSMKAAVIYTFIINVFNNHPNPQKCCRLYLCHAAILAK